MLNDGIDQLEDINAFFKNEFNDENVNNTVSCTNDEDGWEE